MRPTPITQVERLKGYDKPVKKCAAKTKAKRVSKKKEKYEDSRLAAKIIEYTALRDKLI